MKLRPVLTAGAIGTLIAAVNSVPAYADADEIVQDILIVEAQIALSPEATDAPVSAPAGEADLEVPAEEVSEPSAAAENLPPQPALVEEPAESVAPVEAVEQVEPAVAADDAPAAPQPDLAEEVPEEPIAKDAGDDESIEIEAQSTGESSAVAPGDATGAPAQREPDSDLQEETEALAEAEVISQDAGPSVTSTSTQNLAATAAQGVSVVGAEALAQALVGENIEILSVTYTGHEQSAGLFSGFGDAVGIDSGVILSTGYADHQYADDGSILIEAVLYGPNDSSGTTGSMGTEGDADLDALVSGSTRDAAVLEIEFIPTHDTVAFTYVFGSEEYLEYVGSQFNDVFAFFVNGVNFATLDDGTVVSINNISHQTNSEFFRDNTSGEFDTGLDGMTTVLGFEAQVNPGVANILKLAIADVSDRILDSVVMIQAGSFTSPVANTPPVADSKNVHTTIDHPVVVVLTGSDADGDTLSFQIINTNDLAGSLSVDGAHVTFTPHIGFFGNTFFTYVVNDGQVDSDEATVTIFVAGEPLEVPDPAEPIEEPEPTDEPTVRPIKESVTDPVVEQDKTDVPRDEKVVKATDHTPEAALSQTGISPVPLAIGGVLLAATGVALMLWRRRTNQ